jgi:hypothetical protein
MVFQDCNTMMNFQRKNTYISIMYYYYTFYGNKEMNKIAYHSIIVIQGVYKKLTIVYSRISSIISISDKQIFYVKHLFFFSYSDIIK